jgi:hypothetical protein
MNGQDSSGSNIRDIAERMELLRAERCVLLEFPDRDLRQWMIHARGDLAGFVDQWGGGRFYAIAVVAPKLASNLEGTVPPTVAFAHLEHAVTAVEFAKMVHDCCGVCKGMRQ